MVMAPITSSQVQDSFNGAARAELFSAPAAGRRKPKPAAAAAAAAAADDDPDDIC